MFTRWLQLYITRSPVEFRNPALDRQAQDNLQWPSQLQVQIEPRVEAALMKALAIKANDRFQSMEDFKAAITGSITTFAPPVMPAAPPIFASAPPPPPPMLPPTQAQIPPSQVPPSQHPQTAPPPHSSSSVKWLWLMIPLALMLLVGAGLVNRPASQVRCTGMTSRTFRRQCPIVDTTPVPPNPTTNTPPPNPDNATPPPNPDNATATENTTPAPHQIRRPRQWSRLRWLPTILWQAKARPTSRRAIQTMR